MSYRNLDNPSALEEALWDTLTQQLRSSLEDDPEYSEIMDEEDMVLGRHEDFQKILEGKITKPLTFSCEELQALFRYLELENERQEIERRTLYFLGHKHFCHFLVRIGIL